MHAFCSSIDLPTAYQIANLPEMAVLQQFSWQAYTMGSYCVEIRVPILDMHKSCDSVNFRATGPYNGQAAKIGPE
eukprot:scaffold233517_cov39-Prasinocladus_malaysianus.AAC.2